MAAASTDSSVDHPPQYHSSSSSITSETPDFRPLRQHAQTLFSTSPDSSVIAPATFGATSVIDLNVTPKCMLDERERGRDIGREGSGRMPRAGLSAGSSKVDVAIDLGNPLLNRTVDGFLKIGAVGACRVAAEDAFDCLQSGSVSKHKLEKTCTNMVFWSFMQLEKMCKEGAYWGAVAGVYVGMEYGVERVRGEYDWKNALIGGIASGALISAASNNKGNKIAKDAITGGAIATAIEFINYLT
uniref:Outer envelope pore protein 16, chloroplastic n=1 Tax=Aegilops tauschii TaxID=37682 RepID=M8CR09_AEGTA